MPTASPRRREPRRNDRRSGGASKRSRRVSGYPPSSRTTRVASLGAGLAVFPKERSSERIEAVAQVVGDSSYRRNALAVEIARLPPIEHAVALMEAIVPAPEEWS
jgi:hypothetical protein